MRLRIHGCGVPPVGHAPPALGQREAKGQGDDAPLASHTVVRDAPVLRAGSLSSITGGCMHAARQRADTVHCMRKRRPVTQLCQTCASTGVLASTAAASKPCWHTGRGRAGCLLWLRRRDALRSRRGACWWTDWAWLGWQGDGLLSFKQRQQARRVQGAAPRRASTRWMGGEGESPQEFCTSAATKKGQQPSKERSAK